MNNNDNNNNNNNNNNKDKLPNTAVADFNSSPHLDSIFDGIRFTTC